MKKSMLTLSGFSLLASLSSGCATLVNGSTQEVTFQSRPDGATVAVNGRILGKTPLTAQIDRNSSSWAAISKDGYETEMRRLTTDLSGWFWANIPFGGVLIGMAVDGLSGSANHFLPSHYNIDLIPQQTLGYTLQWNDKKNSAVEFIVSFHKEIMTDLAKSGGRYLATLFDTLSVPGANRPDAIDRMRTLSSLYSDSRDFARITVDDLVENGYTGRLLH